MEVRAMLVLRRNVLRYWAFSVYVLYCFFLLASYFTFYFGVMSPFFFMSTIPSPHLQDSFERCSYHHYHRLRNSRKRQGTANSTQWCFRYLFLTVWCVTKRAGLFLRSVTSVDTSTNSREYYNHQHPSPPFGADMLLKRKKRSRHI